MESGSRRELDELDANCGRGAMQFHFFEANPAPEAVS